MFRGKRVLGIIPARGSSKRLPKKNIRCLCDKPLIGWTIVAGRDSKILDKLVVSTESIEIERVTNDLGLTEVIKRSEILAGDDATINDAIVQVVNVMKKRGEQFEYIVLLQPTSPLRTAEHIDAAFGLMEARDSSGVISVCRTEHPVEWMGKLDPNGLLDSFILNTKLDQQSQNFLPSYQINGAIYITPVDGFLKEKSFFLKAGMVAYVMDRASSVDIDDEYDLQLAEWLLKQRENSFTGD